MASNFKPEHGQSAGVKLHETESALSQAVAEKQSAFEAQEQIKAEFEQTHLELEEIRRSNAAELGLLTEVMYNSAILNGIDHSRLLDFVNDADRSSLRSAFGLSESDVLVLNVGTVTSRKGQQDLTGAMEQMDAATRRRVVLAIVGLNGSDYSQAVRDQLRALEQQGLRTIAVEESTSEEQRRTVAELYLCADIFVLTSRIESYPRVTLEAMEFSLPIISTPCFGVCEQLVDGHSALFYDGGDIEKLGAHIRFLCERPEERRKFGRAARDRLKSLNGYEQMLEACWVFRCKPAV